MLPAVMLVPVALLVLVTSIALTLTTSVARHIALAVLPDEATFSVSFRVPAATLKATHERMVWPFTVSSVAGPVVYMFERSSEIVAV
jgi:hypothetical protein